mmetsp:Transcript_4601/g.13963  ORF Transcript_4601/g.13963 Transcript_4601/m.13963 type:complete len:251 (+) Transcript_4601:2205-2957(+)
MMSVVMSNTPSVESACWKSGLAMILSSKTGPLEWVSWAILSELNPLSPAYWVRKEASKLLVFSRGVSFCFSRSPLPMISSMVLYPMEAISSLTSSAMNRKKLTRSEGVPGNFFLSSSLWLATPTGQLLVWQILAMTQPVAIMARVPNPYSSAPRRALIMTSLPHLRPPSARRITLSLSLFCVREMWASARPSSSGPPQCLIELTGLAPVPPSWPEIWMTSAFALATPLAMVPIPAWATSLTLTLAFSLTW